MHQCGMSIELGPDDLDSIEIKSQLNPNSQVYVNCVSGFKVPCERGDIVELLCVELTKQEDGGHQHINHGR